MSEKATPGWPEPDEERAGQLHQFLNNLNLNADRLLLFDQALTHSSYAFEHSLPGDNERLEFLGDTVIGLVVSEWLYSSLPESGEGDLSKKKALFVSRTVLGKRAEALGLGKVLRLGKGDSRSGTRRRSSVLGSALEAFVGAAYLELDYRVVRQFVLDQIAAPSRVYLQQPDLRDYKSMLQEAVQKPFSPDPAIQDHQRGRARSREAIPGGSEHQRGFLRHR